MAQFRDQRTGRWRRPLPYEKNKFFTIDTLSRGLASFAFKSMDRMGEVSNDFADELVDYARSHAPWNDRTGDARLGLESAVLLTDDSLLVELYHTVEYGIWLEVRWGGRYAIIIPTIETLGPRIFERMQGMFGDIIYYD